MTRLFTKRDAASAGAGGARRAVAAWALALAFVLAFLGVPFAMAEDAAAAGGSGALSNGLAAGQLTAVSPQATDADSADDAGDVIACAFQQEAIEALRAAVTAHEPNVAISVDISKAEFRKLSADAQTWFNDYFEQLVAGAFAETSAPNQGDFLRYGIAEGEGSFSMSAGASLPAGSKTATATMAFSIRYIATQQQASLAASLADKAYAEISAGWDDGADAVQKVSDIHDWVVKNVEYDYAYEPISHSAYGAVANRKAVCQGYATLFYYLAKKAGLPVRVISGAGVQPGKVEAHAWNIVSVDGGKSFHNVDTTWDSSLYHKGAQLDWHKYFLNNDAAFDAEHVRSSVTGMSAYDDYAGDEFAAAYPMASSTYVAATEPTCSAAGTRAYWRGVNSDTPYSDPDCTRALGKYSLTYGKALGHDYGEWTVVSEPTYESTGRTEHVCKRCGRIEYTVQPKLVAAKINVPTAVSSVHYTGDQQTGIASSEAYEVSGNTGTGIGSYTATVTPNEGYTWADGSSGAKTVSWQITRAVNPVQAKAKGKALSAKRKKATSFKPTKYVSVSGAQGAVSYKKAAGNAKIAVASNGKITVKKGLKKGTYTLRVNVTAAGNSGYLPATKTVAVKVKVK